jgi:hypothetical protein
MKTTQTPLRSYIHYDPERKDYSVTGEELKRLCETGQNLWKDVCLVAASLGVPCLINGIAETAQQSSFSLTLSMFLNYLVGGLGLALGVVFGIAWYRSRQDFQSLVNDIKQKPKMEIIPEAVDVGSLSTARLVDTSQPQSIEEQTNDSSM